MSRPKTGMLKPKAISAEKIKPFVIRNYTFYPCSYAESKQQGYIYFLFVKYRRNRFPVPELESPRFKSKKEAEDFVDRNNFTKYVIG